MLDLVILAIIAFCVFTGKNKGIVRVALELGSILIALFLASRLGAFAGGILDSIFDISGRLQESINIPLDLTEEINQFIGVIGYIVIFIMLRFIIAYVIRKTSVINYIPLIGTANQVLGGIVGFIKGYLMALIAVWLLSFIALDWAENLLDKSFLAPILLNSFPSLYTKLNLLILR